MLFSNQLDLMKIDEGVNGKIHAKVRQMLNSKAKLCLRVSLLLSIGEMSQIARGGLNIASKTNNLLT